MNQNWKNWYDVRAREIASRDYPSRTANALGTLQGILMCDDLSAKEIVERQRYFLAQLDKEVRNEQR